MAALALAISDIGVCIQHATRVVDIAASVIAPTSVDTSAERTIIASTAVSLEYDIDDAGATFWTILCTGIIYYLYLLDALGRYLLQYLSAVVGASSARPSGYLCLHAGIAPQLHLSLCRPLQRCDILEQVGGCAACCCQHLVYGEGFAIYFQFHLRALAFHLYFLYHVLVFSQIEQRENFLIMVLRESEIARQRLITYK